MTSQIASVLATARDLIDDGDQGEAQQLLQRTLSTCQPARSVSEAVAMAEATGLLIGLDQHLVPDEVIAEHLDRLGRLVEGFDQAEVQEAAAEAELHAIEWVHGESDPIDPITLVTVLSRAVDFTGRLQGSPHVGVRRAAAEAALSAQMIRDWLDQPSAGVAAALEGLALALTDEDDVRIREIRVIALHRAGRMRSSHEDTEEVFYARYLLDSAVRESAELPTLLGLRLAALRDRADLDLAHGVETETALAEAFAALQMDRDPDSRAALLRCQHLDELIQRLPEQRADTVAAQEWGRLLTRVASLEDSEVREAVLDRVRFRADDLSARDLDILRRADAAFRDDDDPRTAAARLRVAARLVEAVGASGSAGRDPALAVQLSEEVDRRFTAYADDPELAPILARLVLDRALRMSDIGLGDEALAVLEGFRARFAPPPDPTPEGIRHLLVQAGYWVARFRRERGEGTLAQDLVDALVSEFGGDPSPDVRIWAANALYSAWRAEGVTDAYADQVFIRFGQAFGGEQDRRFLRLAASGLTSSAHRAHERGDPARAAQVFREVVQRYGTVEDAEIADTVRRARENLGILEPQLRSGGTDAGYRALEGRLFAADGLLAAGRVAEAEGIWRATIEQCGGSAEPKVRLLGYAALDLWATHLCDTGQWVPLIEVARRATVIREGGDVRAERIRGRAHLQLAIGLAKVNDAQGAVAVYDSLERLVAESRDDELVAIRQQGAYNRAVLLDDLGFDDAAIAAYDHVMATHELRIGSPEQRLRQVKALRNKALLLDKRGRLAEAAGAHRQILDIATAVPEAETSLRARTSAFDLATCYLRLGDAASAVATYQWIRQASQLGFTATDLRAAARGLKAAKRQLPRGR